MVAERELVALLYRADWTHLCLSGEVSGIDEPLLAVITQVRAGNREAGGLFPPFPSGPAAAPSDPTRLLIAPGKRYRKDSPDGQFASGCDGEHIWQWWRQPPPGEVRLSGRPEPPIPALLCPSWLLDGYDLEVGEAVSACGRDGVHVVATARHAMPEPGGAPFLPLLSWPPGRFDHVDVIVDTGLGILLRCERRKADRPAELIEFRRLTVDPGLDPEQFTAPAGSILGDGDGRLFGTPFSGTGWEIAKTAAGLAAGGLGAVIRYSPFGPFGPLRPSRPPGDDDAEAAMPDDDPWPGDAADGPPVSDEILHLLYRGGGGVPAFTATLHQWLHPAALLDAVPPSARQAGFGGLGFLVDTLGAAAREAGDQQTVCHLVSSVRIDGWDTYRIDRTYRTRPQRGRDGHRDTEWVTVACDGRQRYLVYADRVRSGPPAPPPAELTGLVDGSWLLRCHLSGGSAITTDGRSAYRIGVSGSRPASPLMMFSFPAIAVLDAESGRLLRLTCYAAGKPVARYELRDVTPGGDANFEVPAGLPVVEESSGDGHPPSSPPPVNLVTLVAKAAGDAIKRRADDKIAATRGFLDALRDSRPPGR